MASQNINITFKRNPTNNNNNNVTGVTGMSYSPSSHTMPAIFQHRDSFLHQRELESNFCSDLVCCGTHIKDLHELLHHYEEHHHAPIEEEPEPSKDNDLPMDDIDTFPLPTQPHEIAALSPLLRNFENFREKANVQERRDMSPKLGRHTEEILKQALPNLVNNNHTSHDTEHKSGTPDLNFLNAEVLYQTCDDGQDKPYKCQIAGCDKAYKNPNGLKYHQVHGHSEEDELSEAERDAQKPYMCTIGYCNKRYKNLNGLKYHIEHSHIAKLKQYPLDGQQWPPSSQ
ncbi:hypothetical protein G6F57_003906 [Rhizopus arrhizus]|uniref:C2H2-type domain-containing protein n=1 Tax=Rhizopus oryzae TaxID=64495 RepID=A0A9P6XFB9_RHIOR|nr:hypothetical protein G6F23_006365 [Rhizopus arrhizus]KAG1427621.1 hypothetical protein G6F58_000949 [Rhizopus delemar]KAG0766395.1 hypothetical protein G6F24_003644 [Rhizopus arrhizus]KAG0793085.1 hypothetical protein G6F21_003874 [Rhizopus arrhizus]KAG0814252.1 hypothetical protein G6F20_004917 [Rhizopus arrhizus]